MCRSRFLRQLRELASEFDPLLISDEVMTGFGQTGADFACNPRADAAGSDLSSKRNYWEIFTTSRNSCHRANPR